MLDYISAVTAVIERGKWISSFWGIATLGLVFGPGFGFLFVYTFDWGMFTAPAYFAAALAFVMIFIVMFLFTDMSKELIVQCTLSVLTVRSLISTYSASQSSMDTRSRVRMAALPGVLRGRLCTCRLRDLGRSVHGWDFQLGS